MRTEDRIHAIENLRVRALRFSAMTLLVCFLAGCESTTQPNDGNFTISGTTWYVGSHAALAGVQVTCDGVSATSQQDGSYVLPGIQPGTHIINAERSDCRPYSDTIEVQGMTKYYIFLNLRMGTLRGVVSNVIDGPVVGATVSMRDIVCTSDLSGRYELPEVPPGSDTLFVSHPDYISSKTVVTSATLDQQKDIVLLRQRNVQGPVIEDAFVEELNPDLNFSQDVRLAISMNGVGAPVNNTRNIFIKFDFPKFFADARVSLLSAQLELLASSVTASGRYRTYAVATDWSRATITYRNQPAADTLLGGNTFGDGSTGRYWAFLRTSGINMLLTRWREGKPNYGVVIQGGAPGTTLYYFSLESLGSPPRVTFTVLY